MRRKTPNEKKRADYKKQRRTHWDSDKAARKAIPAAKRAARQIIRKRSGELIDASLADPDSAPTPVELDLIEKRNRYRSYGHGHALETHVAHQRKGRKLGRLKNFFDVSNKT
jgi:hypothetical protein